MRKEVIMVTGCSSGLGRAICEALNREKYLIVATARNVEDIKTVPADMRLALDVTDDKSIAHAVNEIIKETKTIDILVNNAGFSARAVVEEIDLMRMQQMFDVNVFGTVRMMQEVLPYMRKQNYGKIINIGSISGRMTGIVNGGYCASKYAVEAITEAARYEVGDKNIQVSVIEPGAMETKFFDTLAKNSQLQMTNTESAYRNLYERDICYRKKQSRKSVNQCALQIVKIIEKRKLKTRYTVGVAWIFRAFTHFPDGLKEFGITHFN